jgi:NTE family protein
MKLGIALGGGGAKGFAHIGILQVFQEHGIEFDVVTGTSIGALVGAVYAGGSLAQLEQTAESIKLKDIPLLLSPSWSLSGFFSGQSALEMLETLVPFETIEQLPKTFAAVSVDLATEQLVVMDSGNISEAVRASISIPAIFTPVRRQQQILVDGGLLEPIPVELCRALGATHVIAVDLFGNRQEAPMTEAPDKSILPIHLTNALSYLRSLPDRLMQQISASGNDRASGNSPSVNFIEIIEATLAISQRQLTLARLDEHPADTLLQPAVSKVGLLDFHRGAPVIELGRKCAEACLPEILQTYSGLIRA